ncbi:MAG: methyltransferase domain-containing protein [Acidimicrobiales bacterium]
MKLRVVAARVPGSRAAYRKAVELRVAASRRMFARLSYSTVPVSVAVRLVYQVLLGREPDPGGWADWVGRVEAGDITRVDLQHWVRGSEEFQTRPFSDRALGPSIHAGRCQFIRSLPPARRVVDLGGTHLAREEGSMVALGYPYPFDELVIVDLPADDRHALYRGDDRRTAVTTRLGTVRYRYHSMVDLSGFADDSVDLIYSGQSFEHVTADEGAVVLKEALRILRPGGHLALDTPNARVTRLQQEAFIDPDHKVEYTWPELSSLLGHAGFEIERAQGLNWGGPAVAGGRFDLATVAGNSGLYDDLESCYILAAVCRKPDG